MPQTFYIENDEEIISVIGRLRKSSEEENVFVFPKRALVLQSIVNLRLFQREAQKMGKRIVIVTQDESGKKLAEKAGVETQNYSDDFSKQTPHLELSRATPEVVAPLVSEVPNLSAKDIGSTDFYSAGGEAIVPSVPAAETGVTTGGVQTLRIRDASPQKQTSLNSLRSVDEITSGKMPASSPQMLRPSISLESPVPSAPLPNNSFSEREITQSGREERLKNFFSGTISNGQKNLPEKVVQKQVQMPLQKVATPKASVPVGSKKVGTIFFFLGGVSLLSLIGVALFLFLPKAKVHVIPHKVIQNIDLQFDGRSNSSTDPASLSVRLVEREERVSFTIPATGTSTSSNQKARGTVTLLNNFSSETQPLVATTRLESPEGKIFRLTEGVTIPGQKNGQPGTIEATVIADQAGSEYNIAPSTFTIPGFKGGAKYSKFSAVSNKAMLGGGNGSGSDVSVIAKVDIDKAESQAKEQAKQAYMEAIKGELSSGERVLEEGMEIVSQSKSALPLVGTAASSFDYEDTFKVRAFIFSEKTIEEKVSVQGEQNIGGVPFKPTNIVLTYGESAPNFSDGSVRIKTHALVTLESVIDKDRLTAGLLGKDAEEISVALESFPEVKKIQIDFKPQWFSAVVPKSKDRVTIFVEEGEEE